MENVNWNVLGAGGIGIAFGVLVAVIGWLNIKNQHTEIYGGSNVDQAEGQGASRSGWVRLIIGIVILIAGLVIAVIGLVSS